MGDEDKAIEHEDFTPSTGMDHTASTYQETQVNLRSNIEHSNHFLKRGTIYFQISDTVVFSSCSITQLTVLPIFNPQICTVGVTTSFPRFISSWPYTRLEK